MTHRMQVGEGAPGHDPALDGLADGDITFTAFFSTIAKVLKALKAIAHVLRTSSR